MIRSDLRPLAVLLFGSFIALAANASEESFSDLKFRSIGPAVMGGRIDVVAVSEKRASVLFLGTASGGVWKSTNMGTTWRAVFEDKETSSIGDVAISPSDEEIVWVGTGEANNRQSSSIGRGVFRSDDGGKTFRSVGLEATGHIGKIAVHPSDPDRVYVAALGNLWAGSEERGVYRTTDGGKTWDKVLFIDADTGAVTLAMDPRNPDVLYAAAYQRRRTPWGFAGGGAGSGLFKTTDGGDGWRKLEKGIPQGPLGRIGLSIYRKDPRVVFAILEHATEGGVYRSEDRGESFTKVSSLNPRPMYYSHIFVDPNDEERVYVLGSSFYYSDDGGKNFVENEDMTPTYDVGVHGDHHTLWIDPSDSDHLVLGGDGGLYFSWDRSRSWDKVNNVPLAQFYAVSLDMEEPYNIYGGAQDTHSWMGPSATRHYLGILSSDWRQINFGDGMYQQADPEDPAVAYTSSQGGNVVRLDRRTGDRKPMKPHPSSGSSEYRFHWTAPLLLSRHDTSVIYLGGERLFVSKDSGTSWTASPDLTWNEDRSELPIMGVLPDETTLSRNDGVEDWGTLTTIAESPLDPRLLYVGSDDGRVQLSRDGGASFTSRESRLPLDSKRSTVSRVSASSAELGRVYVALDRHQLGDSAPYLFVSEDFGESFRGIASGLPRHGWVNVVLEHPRNPSLLFVGTETGLFLSFDRGVSWRRMNGNFPNVPVDDLALHPRDDDLVVATHGRSFYVLDDVSALEKHSPDAGVELFEPRKATTFLPWKHESYGAQRQFVGENPPFGALVTYYLPERLESEVRVSVSAPDGATIRTLAAPSEKGFHRLAWDLRAEPPAGVERARGPLVPVGRYRIGLEAGEERRETFVTVVLDPRIDVTDEEFRERYDYLQSINALRRRLRESVERAESASEQTRSLEALYGGDGDESLRSELGRAREAIQTASRALGARTGGDRPPSFRNPNLSTRAASLFAELDGGGAQQGSLHAPTPMDRERLSRLLTEASGALSSFEETARRTLAELNEKLRARGPVEVMLTR